MMQAVYIDPHDVFAYRGEEPPDEDMLDMLTQDVHHQCGLLDELAEGLWGEQYFALAASDHRRTRLERALVRYPLARRAVTPEDAAGVLAPDLLRFRGVAELFTEYHDDHGVTGLTVWWTGGPSWRAMRGLVDNYAAVRAVGLYPMRVVPGARPLVDYVFCERESYRAYDNRRAEAVAGFMRSFCIGAVPAEGAAPAAPAAGRSRR